MSEFETTADVIFEPDERSVQRIRDSLEDIGPISVEAERSQNPASRGGRRRRADGGRGPSLGPSRTAGTTATEPQNAVGVLTESLEVQEQQLAYLEEIADEGSLLDQLGGGDGGILGILGDGAGDFFGSAAGEAAGEVATEPVDIAGDIIGTGIGTSIGSTIGNIIGGQSVNLNKPSWVPLSVTKPTWLPLDIDEPDALDVDEPEEISAEQPEDLEVTRPDWAPFSVTEPSWAPLTVAEPGWAPLAVPEPDWAPFDVAEPGWAPLDVEEVDPLPVEQLDPIPVEDVGPIQIEVTATTAGTGGVPTGTGSQDDESNGLFGALIRDAPLGNTLAYVGENTPTPPKMPGEETVVPAPSNDSLFNEDGSEADIPPSSETQPTTEPTVTTTVGTGATVEVDNSSRVDVTVDPQGLQAIEQAIDEVEAAHEDNVEELRGELDEVQDDLAEIRDQLDAVRGR